MKQNLSYKVSAIGFIVPNEIIAQSIFAHAMGLEPAISSSSSPMDFCLNDNTKIYCAVKDKADKKIFSYRLDIFTSRENIDYIYSKLADVEGIQASLEDVEMANGGPVHKLTIFIAESESTIILSDFT